MHACHLVFMMQRRQLEEDQYCSTLCIQRHQQRIDSPLAHATAINAHDSRVKPPIDFLQQAPRACWPRACICESSAWSVPFACMQKGMHVTSLMPSSNHALHAGRYCLYAHRPDQLSSHCHIHRSVGWSTTPHEWPTHGPWQCRGSGSGRWAWSQQRPVKPSPQSGGCGQGGRHAVAVSGRQLTGRPSSSGTP